MNIRQHIVVFCILSACVIGMLTAQPTVSIGDTSYPQLLTFDLPIRVSNLTSRGIISAQWRLSYNPNTLMAQQVITAGTLTHTWSAPIVNYGSGTIYVAIAGSDTLTGQGVLAYVRFQVQRYATESSPLALANVLLNEDTTTTVQSGTFTPIAGPTIVIAPNRTLLAKNDTATYFASGGTPPYTWKSADTTVVIVDSVKGKVTARKSGAVSLSAFDAVGYDGSLLLTVTDFRAAFPDTTVHIGDSVDVPLMVSDISGLGILSATFKVQYDTTKVTLSGVVTQGTISSGMTPTKTDSVSSSRITLTTATPRTGSGIFVKLRFKHKAPAGVGQTTPLTFMDFSAGNGSPTKPTAIVQNGSIAIAPALNVNPVFTKSMNDTTISEDQLLVFDYDAFDANGDQLKFSLQGPPAGMTMDSVTGVLLWRPTFSQSGNYFFTVVVSDGKGGSSSVQRNITVLNKNRPPVFAAVPPDTSFMTSGSPFNFTYTGSDPDNDPIGFTMLDAPIGAAITAQGTFSWTPPLAQSGIFRVIVSVSDGQLSAFDTSFIRVTQANTPPRFTAVLPDTAINEGQTLLFSYTGADDQNDSLQFFLASSPINGASIQPNGKFQWTPDFFQAGKYSIIVGLQEKQFTVFDTAVVTVVNVNRPPVFTALLPDVTIPVDFSLTFSFAATDPDNDTLTFSLVKSPIGATLQPKGLFLWKPSAAQMGVDTIIVSVSDGSVSVPDTVIITVEGFPSAEVLQTEFEFGSITFGSSKRLTTIVRNNGIIPLTFTAAADFNQSSDINFVLDTTGISTILPGEQKTFGITYTPKSVGGHFGVFVFLTNDPRNPAFVIRANGSAIAKLVVKKRILVDTLHRQSISMTDTVAGFGKFFAFLQQSGIQVTFTSGAVRPHGNDIFLTAVPRNNFTRAEIDSIKQFVNAGGLLIALGNSGSEGNNDALNSLLTDTSWTTNLRLNNDVVVDTAHAYSGPMVPFLTTFIDAKHPYLTNVDTLVFFGSASVQVQGNAIPFISTSPTGTVLNNGALRQPAVVGFAKIGKGKILVSGDVDAWRVDSDTSFPNISIKDNLAFAVNLLSVTEDYAVSLPEKTPNEQYRIVSIPFDLANSEISAVLKDLGGVNPLIWRLFGRFDPLKGTYAEFPSDRFKTFRRGEAYWLITRGAFNISFGNATLVPPQEFYPIKIGPGYSMIGNPFPYTVSWKNSIHDSVQTVLWRFNGESFKAESLAMEPFAGYFVKNLSKDSVTIRINPEDISTLTKSSLATTYGDGEWRIGISARSGKAADQENYAGVSNNADDEFDLHDVAEPPSSPTDYIVVRFINGSWKQHPGSYALDIRSPNAEGLFWDFDVTSAKAQSKVQLESYRLGNLPSNFAVYLIDKRTERAIRVDEPSSYDFTMANGEVRREFRLIAGTQNFIEQSTQGIPLVAMNYSLSQNYPNPFNPVTQIHYSLGHSGYVTLDVYNVLGQKIRSLVNTSQSIGSYSVEWDGKDARGMTASTGIYFYSMKVASGGENIFTSVKKMILMK